MHKAFKFVSSSAPTSNTICLLFVIFIERRKREMLTEDGSRKVCTVMWIFLSKEKLWRFGGRKYIWQVLFITGLTGNEPLATILKFPSGGDS